jgi:four helix bundle protein
MRTEVEQRTKRFSVMLVRAVSKFPRAVEGFVLGKQLLRAGTSIGANYREANRAGSFRDFLHKTNLAEKEASETIYWLEISLEAGVGPERQLSELHVEAEELLAILVTIGKNAKRSHTRQR